VLDVTRLGTGSIHERSRYPSEVSLRTLASADCASAAASSTSAVDSRNAGHADVYDGLSALLCGEFGIKGLRVPRLVQFQRLMIFTVRFLRLAVLLYVECYLLIKCSLVRLLRSDFAVQYKHLR
jgi:hypothetical protein